MRHLNISGDIGIGPVHPPERFVLKMIERHGLANILVRRAFPVDLSFPIPPEKPAGKRGLVKVGTSTIMIEDPTPTRFWRMNLTSYTLFGTV